MSHLRRAPLVLLVSTIVFALFLYFRLQTSDLVSVGLCRIAPFASSSCTPASSSMFQALSDESDTLKLPTKRNRISLAVGSINIRFSSQPAFDSMTDYFDTLERLSATRIGDDNDASPKSTPTYSSPYLMQRYRGERSWLLRGPKVADVALFNDWDIFAFQEVLHGQYQNLVSWLGGEYGHAGVGRDDGDKAGEAVPVFWRRDTFELVTHKQGGIGKAGVEHFWLSPTPDIAGSVGWDAALTRMCTHVSLRVRASGEIIHVFSTHYDHLGVVARAKSSELIVERARKAATHTRTLTMSEPLVILIGDLNSPRNQGSWSTLVSPHYGLPPNSTGASFLDTALSVPTKFQSPILTDNEQPSRAEYASGRRVPPAHRHGGGRQGGMLSEIVGPLRTFTDFQPSARNAVEDRIDFILVLANDAVLDETRNDTQLDHSESPPPPTRGVSGGLKWARDLTPSSEQHSDDAVGEDAGKRSVQGSEGKWRIRSFGTLPNWSEADAGFLISDHRPIMVRMQKTFNPSS